MEIKKETLTEMDKARELFEYEMTSILLETRGMFDNVGKDITSEYLEMEIEQHKLEYSSPDIALSGIKYEQPETGSGLADVQLKAGTVSLGDIGTVPSADKVTVGAVTKVETDYSRVRDAVKAEATVNIEKDFAKNVLDAVKADAKTDRIVLGVSVNEVGTPQMTEIAKVSAEPSVSVEMPSADVSPAVFELGKVDRPSASVSSLQTFSEASVLKCVFDLVAPEISKLNVDYVSVKSEGFAAPELPAYTLTPTEKYEVPQKPDFSSFFDDVLTAVRAEI